MSNDCVIVPDFGGFMAHHAEARYDQEDNTFLPPLRTLGFNPQLTLNDSLLAQSYIEAYDISYPEAISRIASEVAEIRQQLQNTGRFEMTDLGTLTLGEDDNYLFSPCEAGILTPPLYGLSGYTMTALAQEDGKDSEPASPSTPCALTTAETNTQPLAVLTATDEESDDEESADFVTIKKSLLRNLAAACIAIIAFFTLSTPISAPTMQQSAIDTSMLLKLIPQQEKVLPEAKPIVRKTLATGTQQTNASSTNDAPQQTAVQETASKTDAYYTIVLASKITKQNAQAYIRQLQQEGIEGLQLITTPGNVKIVAGQYTTEADARKELRKMHQASRFADCWITKVN